nr:acylneuraminate cytidylyltransferase [Candidatus Krumholzibacteriota bacterium]
MNTQKLKDNWPRIKTVITDVDGVLTDGGMYYTADGGELKKFNVRDGVGAALLKAGGYTIGVMTGESLPLLERRMRKMGADFIYLGARD